MKKVILYSLLTVLSVMFYECGKSEEAPGETYTFQFSEEDWAVPVAGANKNVPLEAPGEWTAEVVYVSGSGKWLNATPLKGKAGQSQINLSVGKNTSYDEAREATLTVTCGTESKSIKITQDTQEGVVIEQQLFNLKPGDTLIAVKVSANVGYEHTIDKSAEKWILPAEAKSSMKDSTIRFQVLANDTDKERTGTITFSPTKGNDVTVTVKQACEPRLTLLQLNLWMECTKVPNAFNALVDQIVSLQPDFATFCELYKGGDEAIMPLLVDALKQKGLTYYQSRVDGRGLLSKYRITETQKINEWMFKGVCNVDGRRIAVYPSHANYVYYSCYYPRGYNDGGNNGDWSKMATGPNTDVALILERNRLSGRPQSTQQFIDDAKNEIAKGALVFFAGDLNEPSHLDWQADTKDLWDHNGCVVNWQSSMLMYDNGFIDAYRETYPNVVDYPGLTWPADNKDVDVSTLVWAGDADERDRIDFVYYYPRQGLSVEKAQIVGPSGTIVRSQRVENDSKDEFIAPAGGHWPSDHKGLLITFKLDE